MRRFAFPKNTSELLFVSVDGINAVPNESHPLWRRFSEAEKSRLLSVAQELEHLHELEFSDPTISHEP